MSNKFEHYEEKFDEGLLYYRTQPTGEWHELPPMTLVEKITRLETENRFMSAQIDELNKEMPCGHTQRWLVKLPTHTEYCAMCRSKSLEVCDLEVRKQLERMTILYHQSNRHQGGFSNCEHAHCEESRKLSRGES